MINVMLLGLIKMWFLWAPTAVILIGGAIYESRYKKAR